MLANIALREGARADVGLVVMDEFHYYGEPDRGWAWQVPLLELPNAQFVLMSATLGDMSEIAADLTRRTGRETAVVAEAERPVPLSFSWSLDPLDETVEELRHDRPGAGVRRALHPGGRRRARDPAARRGGLDRIDRQQQGRHRREDRGFRFGAGFGKTLRSW